MLSSSEIQSFITDGYVAVRGAFADVAEQCQSEVRGELAAQGVLASDRSTWTQPVVWMLPPRTEAFSDAAWKPVLTEAFDQLVGADAWKTRLDNGLGGMMPIRFPSEQYSGGAGWHIDASYPGTDSEINVFDTWYVNVQSKARGLLMLFLFTDVDIQDAPTHILGGSHLAVAKALNMYGEGGHVASTLLRDLDESVFERTVAHATGKAGDVYLCHPFLVHRATWPHRGVQPRFLAQPPLELTGDHFAIDGSDTSPVAQAIVRGISS